MTAIAGFWGFSEQDPGECCRRMLKAQLLYGPHHEAKWQSSQMALGRNLFRLLPEDVHDRGPVNEPSRGLTLVADIRLDNREELGAALGLSQGELDAASDTAVLMRALLLWGEEALDRIVGDFAFALWDARREWLLLARDFAGQRPLHFHRAGAFFAFASMPKGLHALSEIPYAPDRQAAADFLALMPLVGTRSFFTGVERVPPGCLVTVTREEVSIRRYWRPSREPLRLAGSRDYEEALREKLDQAVRSRLRGAGTLVASHLSGGLDSSAVAATAARLLAPQGGKVVAFTSVPLPGQDDGGQGRGLVDEGPLAAATASLYSNIEHVRVSAGGISPVRHLDRNFFLFEQPLLNLCNTTWAEAIDDQAAARGIKVVLNGQLGNMSFSYEGLEWLAELLGRGRLLALGRQAAMLRQGGMGWRRLGVATFGPYLPLRLWGWFAGHFGTRLFSRYSAIEPSAVKKFSIVERAKEEGTDPTFRPGADGFAMRLLLLRYTEVGNYNKGVLGGWGLDRRDPSADRRLVEFCLRVPPEEFLLGGIPRSLARRAFADRLPSEVLQERRKGQQASDWHIGLSTARNAISDELERLDHCPPVQDLLDVRRLREDVAHMPEGGWNDPEPMQRYRLALLRGLSAGHFVRKASGSN